MKSVYKKMTIFSLVLSLILTICFCSVMAQEVYTIKYTHVLTEEHASHITARDVFKKYLEEESNGRLKVEIYPNAQLGGERQQLESIQLGTIDMTLTTGSVLTAIEDKFLALDLPYLFKSEEEAYRLLDGELGDTLNQSVLPKGVRILAIAENGFRNITNSRGPITTPEDVKGLKIRTMETPVHMDIFRALGANPTPMSFGELYTALQQGTVDAQENPVPIIYTSKFYEVQDYCTLDGHVYGTAVIMMNANLFDSLPEDLQQIVLDGAARYRDAQREMNQKMNDEMVSLLREEGMEVTELTPEQKQLFIDATIGVYDKYSDQIGKDMMDLVKRLTNR
jgi:tripartite ATP-independent transporter DctP family solute receptor